MRRSVRLVLAGVALVLAAAAAGCNGRIAPDLYEPDISDARLQEQMAFVPVGRLKVGAWNTYYLGSPSRRQRPRVEKDLCAMARYIADSGVSLLSVAEVRGEADMRSLQLELILKHLPGRWQYRLFEQYEGQGQCTGVAWDQDRLTLKGFYELQVDRCPEGWRRFALRTGRVDQQGHPLPIHNRKVFAVHFSAGEGLTDFAIVPLHLSSSQQRGPYIGSVRRYYEMATLLDALPLQTFARGEHDVILIGDTNCLADRMESFKLSSGRTTSAPRYATSWAKTDYFRQLGGSPGDDTFLLEEPLLGIGRTVAPLDRAFVPRAQPEFASSQLIIKSAVKNYARGSDSFVDRLSDHLLVSVPIWIGPDDD